MKLILRELYYRLTRPTINVTKVNFDKNSDSIYIIGNGPSLNKIKIEKLKSKETISFNRAYIAYEGWGFYPTIYMVVDKIVLNNIKEDIIELIQNSPIKLFVFPLWSKDLFPESNKIQYLNLSENRYVGKSFSNMGIIANVGATAISVLHKLHYKNIIILGTDCNYEEKLIKNVKIEKTDHAEVYKSSGDTDVNHFRPDYFGKGTEYSKPQAGNHYSGWKLISRMVGYLQLNIILCSPGSKLASLFKEKDFNQIIERY